MPRKPTTLTKSRTAQKIELLQNLINHPRTAAEEREAAQRMLKRVIERARDNGEDVTDTRTPKAGGYRLPEVVYGDKYKQVKGMRLPDIAKLMRADIKIARKVGTKSSTPGALATVDPLGDMPKEIKVSVTSEYFAGGGAIRMRVKNIPLEWGFVQKRDQWGDMRWVPSDAFEAVLTDLKVIHQAYNYDGSDSQVDYYHVNYYGSVDYDRPAPPQDPTPKNQCPTLQRRKQNNRENRSRPPGHRSDSAGPRSKPRPSPQACMTSARSTRTTRSSATPPRAATVSSPPSPRREGSCDSTTEAVPRQPSGFSATRPAPQPPPSRTHPSPPHPARPPRRAAR